MFPIRDDNPALHTSMATFALIGINVLIWVFIQGLGFNPALARSVCEFGLVPGELLGQVAPGTRLAIGEGLHCVMEGEPQWSTLLTSMFMHGSWLHIIGNMWFLFVFGDNVEDVMGPIRFVIFYLLCGLAAAATQIASSPASVVPMVGASGAIGGVMGAYAVLFPRVPVHMLVFIGIFFTRIIIPAFMMLGYWFALQFISGIFAPASGGGVAVWAHVGGFLTGIVMVKLFANPQRLEASRRRRGKATRLIERWFDD